MVLERSETLVKEAVLLAGRLTLLVLRFFLPARDDGL